MISRAQCNEFLIIAFFGIYLVTGLIIFKDYGVHVDEWNNQNFGHHWYTYIQKTVQQRKILSLDKIPIDKIDSNPDDPLPHAVSHGPVWELALQFITTKMYAVNTDSRPVVLTRHLFSFLLFYISAFFFYQLAYILFKRYSLAVCGALFYILHPRIFADSFYNTVDLGFLSFFTIALYTLANFLKNKDIRSARWHAVACALAIDVRSAGLLLPFVTTSFLLIDIIKEREPANRWRLVQVTGGYLVVMAGVMFLFWPLLWSNPLEHFIVSLKGGVFSTNRVTPPEYNIFWIGMTTPPGYVLLFIIGFLAGVGYYFRDRGTDAIKYRMFLAALFLFIAPISLSAVLKSTLYDGWRHHYFVYSSFALICVFGIERLLDWIKRIKLVAFRNAAVIVVLVMIAFSFLNTVYFMARFHPHQFAYANVFARRDPQIANDYWMVGGRHALEYILEQDHRPEISIGFPEWGDANIYILPEEQWSRLVQVGRLEDADYVVANYATSDASVGRNRELFYTLKIGGVPILVIYKKIT